MLVRCRDHSVAPRVAGFRQPYSADRANLPTARSVRRRLGLKFHNPETQQLEIGVTGVARSVGEARRPTRRSYVSSRPLFGAHNSAIGAGHRHAVDAATEIVAKPSPARGRRDYRSPGMPSRAHGGARRRLTAEFGAKAAVRRSLLRRRQSSSDGRGAPRSTAAWQRRSARTPLCIPTPSGCLRITSSTAGASSYPGPAVRPMAGAKGTVLLSRFSRCVSSAGIRFLVSCAGLHPLHHSSLSLHRATASITPRLRLTSPSEGCPSVHPSPAASG